MDELEEMDQELEEMDETMDEAELSHPYDDENDPAYNEYQNSINACPKCDSDNVEFEQVPSMLGHGFDHSAHCLDCGNNFEPGDSMEESEELDQATAIESVEESLDFDRFMDRIVLNESNRKMFDAKTDTPQRQHAKLYRERYQNSIRFGLLK